MELERTLFRVHERFLAVEGVKKSVNYCLKSTIALVLLTLPLFIYGNMRFMYASPCIQPYVNTNFILQANPNQNSTVQAPQRNETNQTIGTEGKTDGNGRILEDDESTESQTSGLPDQTTASNSTVILNQTTENNQTQEGNKVVEGIPLVQGKPIIGPEDLVVVRIANSGPTKNMSDVNLTDTDNLYSFFEFSGTFQVVLMDPNIRSTHNFTQHNITIDVSCYSDSFFMDIIMYFLDYENIVLNELIYTFQDFDRYMKNNITGETWSFSNTQVLSITQRENIFSHISSRFFGILKLLLGIFLVSNITAIYNKMTIICAPIFILAAYSLCSHPSQRQYDRTNIYRAFPWIGMYLYTLNNNGRRKDRYIIFAFFCMITIFYCLYLAALIFWNLLLFAKSYPKGLDENFYAVLALVEFLVLLFLRTRTTLKFFPQMSMLVILMFLYYVQYTPYGFYAMSLFMMAMSVFGLLAYFLLHFEIPALDWNPSYHYTPSIDSPRTLYFPIFSLTWYHDIPQLWTMFFPMYGRSHFTNTELAMVNRNYPLLMTTLENASQGIRPQDDQNLGANDANVGNNNVNNFPFGPQQEMANLQAQGNNAPNEAAPGRLNANSGSNLLAGNQNNSQQNTEPDYVLNISDDRPNNNTRLLNWRQNEENTGSQYRRIDDEA